MPTVTITDDATTPTGLNAVVSGGGGSEFHELYVTAFNSISGWAVYDTVVGDGTLNAGVQAGSYFAYVASDGVPGAISLIIVTDGLDAVHYRCLLAVQTRVRLLGLTGLVDASVIVRKLPKSQGFDDGTYALPGIILSSMGTEEQARNDGSNVHDNIGYPVICNFVAKDNNDLITNQDTYLLWRQRVNRAFRNQRLAGVPEVYNCSVVPGPIVAPTNFAHGQWHSSLILKFKAREPRG